MLTAEIIKQKAKELGAAVCGIGKIYDEPDIQKDPRMILPEAKCIIGFISTEHSTGEKGPGKGRS